MSAVRTLIIMLIALTALQAATANICLSNCGGGAPAATRTPLGDYISDIDTSPAIGRDGGDIQINASLGVKSCGIDANTDGNKCEEPGEALCDDTGKLTCAEDCNPDSSCLLEWVDKMRNNGDDTDGYTSGSELCLDPDHFSDAQAWCDGPRDTVPTIGGDGSCTVNDECSIGFKENGLEYVGTLVNPGSIDGDGRLVDPGALDEPYKDCRLVGTACDADVSGAQSLSYIDYWCDGGNFDRELESDPDYPPDSTRRIYDSVACN